MGEVAFEPSASFFFCCWRRFKSKGEAICDIGRAVMKSEEGEAETRGCCWKDIPVARLFVRVSNWTTYTVTSE